MKKIVIAPDSFKESLTALEVAEAIKNGFQTVYPNAEYVLVPMADGGEGTVEALVAVTDGKIVRTQVTGPLGNQVDAHYGLLGDGKTAVIEMASASGLHHVALEERDPCVATSRGTGELVRHALDAGVRHIIVGLGGSATNDAGIGMLMSLGAKFSDAQDKTIGDGGAALIDVKTIDLSELHPAMAECTFEVACDVDNPLLGERGATAIFGPQKGATEEKRVILEKAITHLADVIVANGFSDQRNTSGAGAAGGMGFGMMTFMKATFKPGIEIVVEATNLKELVKGADLVITGEGRLDSQTIFGKTPIGVARTAKLYDIPVIGIAGSLSADVAVVCDHGIDAVFSIMPRVMTLKEAFADAEVNVTFTAQNIATVMSMHK
ncbi:glycerate kinase [Oceanisphaera sp. W20_SRM_FM3]|uniref:glycerate kinase n=1 Tax=Oceanisphaera sp. W20_SRM_FM3 TaxID=3240267 RepID=UPI003F949A72